MNINKNNVSLELAKRLSAKVNASLRNGEMLSKVTPITAELLKFWFAESFCLNRDVNFHEGQRQAILNIIYLHEVVKEQTVADSYREVIPDLMDIADSSQLHKAKYQFPKYAVMMATGTGKTWVMHALIIWQVLNARRETTASGRFTRNFLLVALGIIVYERLLDAFLGRRNGNGSSRDPQTSDFVRNQNLLLPPQYRQEFFSFVQNNVVSKEAGIGRKITAGGLIAITNWHLFEHQLDDGETENAEDTYNSRSIKSDILPVSPGKNDGNDLSVLDRRKLKGIELEYLSSLPDLMVINDEAHHIHELKRNGETEEVEWQQSLDRISEGKGSRFFQIDFSATAFDARGRGRRMAKVYFPHIVINFDLSTAMRHGLVKLLLYDNRQNLTELKNLDYNARRDDDGRVIGLSRGQMVMLRAGLTKLKMLEREFLALDEHKYPKMMVACEDTSVTPYVEAFLKTEGLNSDDIISVDSNRQNEVTPEEWARIKGGLFDIDHRSHPKVIIQVLMLREGFDVNNICVLVLLRSADSNLLIEQLVGRGLRLMWREPYYQSQKQADRDRWLSRKKPPESYIDTLSVIEHPAFSRFYQEKIDNGEAVTDDGDIGQNGATGDTVRVPLREDYKQYDLFWPVILHDAEQEIDYRPIDINGLEPFEGYPLDVLRKFLATDGETFISQEQITKTRFGRYKVSANLFTAESYNEYLQKLLRTIVMKFPLRGHMRALPTIQINEAETVGAMDRYIRTRLFDQPFDPFSNNNWKILLARDGIVTDHIVRQFAVALVKMQQQLTDIPAEVIQKPFSSVSSVVLRESFSTDVAKCIYTRQGWPAHGGGLEQAFMALLESDVDVERWLKISESQHVFASIDYIRTDGLMATYHPDFMVATKQKVYIIETKGENMRNDGNVRQKRIAATAFVNKVNALPADERMCREWEYVLVGEDIFYHLNDGYATLTDICNRCKLTYASATGSLF